MTSFDTWNLRLDPRAPTGLQMETEAEILQRWRDLREMLIKQLAMFESGVLSLHSNDMDVAPVRIDELKRQIFDFDGLIESRIRPARNIRASTPKP